MVLSEQAAKTHAGRLLTKLGLRDRIQAVIAASENDLVVSRSTPWSPKNDCGR
jgi:DNA-binding NarL/FixJ family response regulator